MSQTGLIIAPGAKLGSMYAQRLMTGVTPEMFARLARPGGVEVKSNHPAFVFGHLSLYPARIMQNLNLPLGATAYPPDYEGLFKAGAECRDDPNGTIYPPMKTLVTFFTESYRLAIAAVESATEDLFAMPNPAEGRLRELFPTIGAAINFYLIGHVQNHLGQLSAWRRAMGLPAA
ncbi:MAG: DinB family protein [Phycisphaerae bacterium]